MKELVTFVLLATGLQFQGFCQGSLLFNNIVTGDGNPPPSSPVTIRTAPGNFNPADGPPGAYVGADYTASLFWLNGTITNQTVFDSLNPMWVKDVTFFGTTGTGPDHGPSVDGSGLFDGGQVYLLGQTDFYVTLQVRAWYNAGGAYTSYEAAKAAGHNAGLSNLLPLIVTAPPIFPRNLDGLLTFTVGIPEPSTSLLVILGCATLVLFGCRNNSRH